MRKPGKLPSARVRESYALEYGTDTLEMHEDAVKTGQRVLIVDDLLATGGTARATATWCGRSAGTCTRWRSSSSSSALNGRDKLAGEQVHASLQY